MADLRQLDELEKYLQSHTIAYVRKDVEEERDEMGRLCKTERHQICVPSDIMGEWQWDVICHKGSYGYEEGLLELMGTLLTEEELRYDTVRGYLTAKDIIERIEGGK